MKEMYLIYPQHCYVAPRKLVISEFQEPGSYIASPVAVGVHNMSVAFCSGMHVDHARSTQ